MKLVVLDRDIYIQGSIVLLIQTWLRAKKKKKLINIK